MAVKSRIYAIVLLACFSIMIFVYVSALAVKSTFCTNDAYISLDHCPAPKGWQPVKTISGCQTGITCPGHPEVDALMTKNPVDVSTIPATITQAFESEHLADYDDLVLCRKSLPPTLMYAVMVTSRDSNRFAGPASYSDYYFGSEGVLLYKASGTENQNNDSVSGSVPNMSGYACEVQRSYSKECYTTGGGGEKCEHKLSPAPGLFSLSKNQTIQREGADGLVSITLKDILRAEGELPEYCPVLIFSSHSSQDVTVSMCPQKHQYQPYNYGGLSINLVNLQYTPTSAKADFTATPVGQSQ